jgi:hypothetical protein
MIQNLPLLDTAHRCIEPNRKFPDEHLKPKRTMKPSVMHLVHYIITDPGKHWKETEGGW